MQGLGIKARASAQLALLVAAASLCSADAMAAKMAGDPAVTCGDLIRPADNVVRIDSATMVGPTPRTIAEKGPTPAARITPANPQFCRVLGQIAPCLLGVFPFLSLKKRGALPPEALPGAES